VRLLREVAAGAGLGATPLREPGFPPGESASPG
jgi:hypothetical protein